MSNNGNSNRYFASTSLNRYLDETFYQLFIIDEYGDSIAFQNLDEVIEKVILYETITSNRLFVWKTSFGYQYRQYGCSCSRVCAFYATFAKRQSDGLVVIKSYNIKHTFPFNRESSLI